MATRVGDPFNNLAPTPSNGTPTSSDGRISNITSQSSGTSSRNASGPPQEVNRRKQNASRTATTSAVNNTEPPPAKRVRRTEAAPPLAPPPQSRVSFRNNDTSNDNDLDIMCENVEQPEDPNPAEVPNIGELIDKLEKRNNSPVYKAMQRILSRPRVSEEDYLKSLPGHDVVLCPESDDEDED